MRAVVVVVALGCGRVAFEPAAGRDAAIAAEADAGGCAIASLAVGEDHVCALVDNGTAYCAGDNTLGALGLGIAGETYAMPVVSTRLSGARSLFAGGDFTCAGDATGQLRCLGYNRNSRVDTMLAAPIVTELATVQLPAVAEVSLGRSSSCARTTGGDVYCWGDADEGQTGVGIAIDQQAPQVVSAVAGAVSISTGTTHACAVTSDGATWCWGDGRDLRMNAPTSDTCPMATGGSISCALTPVLIAVPAAKRVVAGDTHTCVVTVTDEVWCWGSNDQGQLARPKSVAENAAAIAGMSGVASLVSGSDHSCVRYPDGTVACWGDNGHGQLGSGTSDSITPVIVPLPAPATLLAVHPKGDWTCALLADRSVACWGDNAAGQLGRSTVTPSEPVGPFTIPCP